MVIWWHFKPQFSEALPAATAAAPFLSLFNEGHTGVSLFFTLSGFIFTFINHGKEIAYKQFIVNRVLRIAPLAFFWIFYFFVTQPVAAAELLPAIVFGLNKGAIPGVGWSIAIEWQFYLLFPFLLVFFRRYGLKFIFGVIFLAFVMRNFAYFNSGSAQGVAFGYMYGRIDQFLLGMAAGHLLAGRWTACAKHAPALAAGGLLLASFSVFALDLCGGFSGCGGGHGPFTSTAYLWTYFGALEGCGYAMLILGYVSFRTRLPSSIDNGVAYLGAISYSIYWCHGSALEIVCKIPGLGGLSGSPWGVAVIFLFVAMPSILFVSTLSYFVIEKPFLELRGNYARSKLRAETRVAMS